MKARTILLEILCGFFSVLFLYTGVMKLIDHSVFLHALWKSPLLDPYSAVLSWAVPIGELLIAIAILLPRTRRIGLYGFMTLMAIFTVYVGFMVYFRTDRPCTCGGIINYLNWHMHFYVNSATTALSVLALVLQRKSTTHTGSPNTLPYMPHTL